MQTIKLKSNAWYGDSQYDLDFPDEWRVSHIQMPKIAALTRAEIQAKINTPIRQKTLRELAVGRKSAIIVIDDLTRPTPVEVPLQIIFAELMNAGMLAEQIQILVAGGTHQPLSEDDIRRKIGADLSSKVRVLAHSFQNNLTYLGKTHNSTPVHINKTLMDADLKIGVGGIYPHPSAGFSGGAKIIAPGAAGIETIRFMHSNFKSALRRGDDLENEFRRECEEVARMAGLDFIVNLALNQDRQIAGVFAGDFVAAHRQGTATAKDMYTVLPVHNADIIIADAYPFDGELLFAHDRGFWPLSSGSSEAVKIILAVCTNGIGTHELFPLGETFGMKVWRKLRHFQWRELKKIPRHVVSAFNMIQEKEVEITHVSKSLSLEDFQRLFPAGKLHRDWNATKTDLISMFAGRQPHIAIYQCSPLLIPKADSE